MKKETPQRELSPIELWDQLAVSMIKKQLAPNGYKKVYHGKSEVSNIQFLGKQTVNQTALISANLVRLYRENVNSLIAEWRRDYKDQIDKTDAELKTCTFWQIRKRRDLNKRLVRLYAMDSGLCRLEVELDYLKPSTPKAHA